MSLSIGTARPPAMAKVTACSFLLPQWYHQNFLRRRFDDGIAIYGHSSEYSDGTKDTIIRNRTLLPDVAHTAKIGTHGSPQ